MYSNAENAVFREKLEENQNINSKKKEVNEHKNSTSSQMLAKERDLLAKSCSAMSVFDNSGSSSIIGEIPEIGNKNFLPQQTMENCRANEKKKTRKHTCICYIKERKANNVKLSQPNALFVFLSFDLKNRISV